METVATKSWARRMAEEVATTSGSLNPELFEGLFEAAGEMKCVQLKVLLGRCLEVIRSHIDENDYDCSELLESIDKAIS